jgi:hypothetical protein
MSRMLAGFDNERAGFPSPVCSRPGSGGWRGGLQPVPTVASTAEEIDGA